MLSLCVCVGSCVRVDVCAKLVCVGSCVRVGVCAKVVCVWVHPGGSMCTCGCMC